MLYVFLTRFALEKHVFKIETQFLEIKNSCFQIFLVSHYRTQNVFFPVALRLQQFITEQCVGLPN